MTTSTRPRCGRWQLSRRDPPRPQPPLPVVAPDLQAPEPSITWIGHSTVLARLGGLAVLTDPQFSERASPVSWAGPKRVGTLPLTPAQLPQTTLRPVLDLDDPDAVVEWLVQNGERFDYSFDIR